MPILLIRSAVRESNCVKLLEEQNILVGQVEASRVEGVVSQVKVDVLGPVPS